MIVPRLSKYNNYKNLSAIGKTTVEYIWIDNSDLQCRSKIRVVDNIVTKPEDVPAWSYDGSSTG